MHSKERGDTALYRIIIAEELDESWQKWFRDMDMRLEKDGDGTVFTHLTGPIADQSALNGILNSILGLNLTLISVRRLPDDEIA
jgi:hypothetical protein